MRPLRVLLVDDQPLFIEGLANLLTSRGTIVVGTASDGLEALEKVRLTRPDVVLMDVRMPRSDGLQATRLIKAEFPETRIIMLTVSAADDDVFAAIRAGASGYLLKSLDADALFFLLSTVQQGDAPLSPSVASKLVKAFAGTAGNGDGSYGNGNGNGSGNGHSALYSLPSTNGSTSLTSRQMAVLSLVAGGRTYKEVGAELCLTERTIKYHVEQIRVRLRVKKRAEAIAYARRAGLILEDATCG